MAKKVKVVTSPPPPPVVSPPPPPVVVIASYLLDMLGNTLTDNSGNRLVAQ